MQAVRIHPTRTSPPKDTIVAKGGDLILALRFHEAQLGLGKLQFQVANRRLRLRQPPRIPCAHQTWVWSGRRGLRTKSGKVAVDGGGGLGAAEEHRAPVAVPHFHLAQGGS